MSAFPSFLIILVLFVLQSRSTFPSFLSTYLSPLLILHFSSYFPLISPFLLFHASLRFWRQLYSLSLRLSPISHTLFLYLSLTPSHSLSLPHTPQPILTYHSTLSLFIVNISLAIRRYSSRTALHPSPLTSLHILSPHPGGRSFSPGRVHLMAWLRSSALYAAVPKL